MRVVALAGGTGGAKLAAGLYDLLAEELTVIANTGDDVDVYGVHVSPDPDLLSYWLAGVIDDRGWGIRGDSFTVMEALEAAGRPSWFRLGDRDLAMCLIRTERLRAGGTLTEAHGDVLAALGVRARVLPMSDDPVRTHVRVGDRWRGLQQFLIVDRAEGEIGGVEFRGRDRATMTPAVADALERADAIVIGPSNPIISIGPILAVGELRAAIERAPAPVVAVSPLVGGRALKGPTEAFMSAAGYARDAHGVAAAYSGLIDGLVTDEHPAALDVPVLSTETTLSTADERRRVSERTLAFAAALRS